MTPTETLMHEHQVILLVVEAAEREMESIRRTSEVNAERVGEMLDFFRTFTDGCHHAKEEWSLFPKMCERGMSRESGPIMVLLQEHEFGRGRLREIAGVLPDAANGDDAAIKSVADGLHQYVLLLRGHIAKEDKVLYPMADRMFTPEDQKEVQEAFEKTEAEEMGEGTHEKYHELAHKLAAAYAR